MASTISTRLLPLLITTVAQAQGSSTLQIDLRGGEVTDVPLNDLTVPDQIQHPLLAGTPICRTKCRPEASDAFKQFQNLNLIGRQAPIQRNGSRVRCGSGFCHHSGRTHNLGQEAT